MALTKVGLSLGGTNAALTDPNADRILFWDDSATAFTFLTAGAGLDLTGTTLTVADNSITGAKIALGSDAAGDIMYHNGTDYVRLPKGTADQVLTMNDGATAPGWETASSGGASLSGSTDNTIVTVTGANAMQGEAKLTFDASSNLIINNTAGSANFNRTSASSNGQIVENWNRGGTAIWQWGIDGDGSSNQKASTSDFAWYNNTGSGVYKIVFSHATGGIGTAGSLAVGGATIPTSGAGIAFPATQSASTNSNTLDDYEEGTWTPSLRDGGGRTAVLDIATARYTKVGRLVHIQIRARVQTAGNIVTSTETLYIHGLPFNAQNSASDLQSSFAVGLIGGASVTAGHDVAALIEQNGSTLVLLINDTTTGMSNLQWGQAGTGFHFSCAGFYTV